MNSLNNCLQDVLELAPTIDLITVFCILNFLVFNSPPPPIPQNNIPTRGSDCGAGQPICCLRHFHTPHLNIWMNVTHTEHSLVKVYVNSLKSHVATLGQLWVVFTLNYWMCYIFLHKCCQFQEISCWSEKISKYCRL